MKFQNQTKSCKELANLPNGTKNAMKSKGEMKPPCCLIIFRFYIRSKTSKEYSRLVVKNKIWNKAIFREIRFSTITKVLFGFS